MSDIIRNYLQRYYEPSLTDSVINKRSLEDYKEMIKYYQMLDMGKSLFRNKDQECGLRNIGNTCYFNAVVQLLYHINGLRDFFINLPTKEGNQKGLLTQFKNLFGRMMLSKYAYCDPSGLFEELNNLNNDMIALGDEHDFNEYFVHTLEKLDKRLSKQEGLDGKYQNRYIEKTFFGKMNEVLNDGEIILNKSSVPFGVITLDPKKKTFEKSFEAFKSYEIEGYKNSKGQSVKAKKELEITEFPAILTFNLNRVYLKNGKYEKDNTVFSYPSFLQLSKEKDRFNYKMTKQQQIIQGKIVKIKKMLEKKDYQKQLQNLKQTQKYLEFQEVQVINQLDDSKYNGNFGIYGSDQQHENTKKRLRFYIQNLEKQEKYLLESLKKLEEEKRKIAENNKLRKYNIFALIIHSGTVDSGHYYILIYNETQCKWRKYNDRIVTEISEEEVHDLASGKVNQRTNVCSIFYKLNDFKCNSFEKPAVPMRLKTKVNEQDNFILQKIDQAKIQRMLKTYAEVAKQEVQYLSNNISVDKSLFINYFSDPAYYYTTQKKYKTAEVFKFKNLISEPAFLQQIRQQCSTVKDHVEIVPLPITINKDYIEMVDTLKLVLDNQNNDDLRCLNNSIAAFVQTYPLIQRNGTMKPHFEKILTILLFKLCFIIDLKLQKGENVDFEVDVIKYGLQYINQNIFLAQIQNNIKESVPKIVDFKPKNLKTEPLKRNKPLESISISRLFEARFKVWRQFYEKIEKTKKVITQNQRKQKQTLLFIDYMN